MEVSYEAVQRHFSDLVAYYVSMEYPHSSPFIHSE